ncbi:MAG: hypothetical protein ACOC7J_03725, partial [Armatimonadota bacterium]
ILEWRFVDHRKMIELNLEKRSADLRVAPKYWWLAAYHNAFCRFVDDPEAQITGAAFPPPHPVRD